MRIELDSLWPDSPFDLRALERVLSGVKDGFHELTVQNIDAMEQWHLLGELSSTDRELLQKAAEASVYLPHRHSGPHTLLVRPEDAGWTHVAYQATTPLYIFVENSHTDKTLINAAIHAYATATMRALWQAKVFGRAAISFHHCGGHGELIKQLTSKLKEEPHLRALVVTDSDAEQPSDPKPHAQKILKICSGLNIPCGILQKRTIENYIPDDVLIAWSNDSKHNPNLVARINKVIKLNPADRDHTDLKKTLGKKLPGTPKRDLIELLEIYRSHATATTFNNRDRRAELHSIVITLEAMI